MDANSISKRIPGVGYCLSIGLIAFSLVKKISILGPIGSTTLSLLIGITLAHLLPFLNKRVKNGIAYSEKKILPFAIALMGFSINFHTIADAGTKGAIVVFVSIGVSLFSALFIGKLFGLQKKGAFLLGMGNGICGTSAIVATATVIGADEDDEGIAIPVVNFLGVVGIALIPLLARLLHFSEESGGIFAGATLQAVGQATAAAFALGDTAGSSGVIIKMFRITMLGPILIVVSFLLQFRRGKKKGEQINFAKFVPLFLVFFLSASIINTFVQFPETLLTSIALLSKIALLTAMAAIGLKIHVKILLGQGIKILLLGIVTWGIQISVVVLLLNNI